MGGGGGGGGVRMSALRHLIPSAQARERKGGGGGGILPQETRQVKVKDIEINLESHNLVQNIPHESTNGGPPTQRTILNVNSRSTEIPFPFILSILIYIFFTISGLPRLVERGGGGSVDAPIALPSLRA